jgi:3-isopropylmalate dehydratase small subunit
MHNIEGKAWKFGDDIDTDAIIPARYLNTSDPKELAKYCMEDADASFAGKVAVGDIIVAGKNFGCGSSREHAPIAIKAAGVSCIIAPTFARIFYRNAFNTGLLILESADAAAAIAEGHQVSVDPASGTIKDITSGQTFQARPVPEFMQKLLDDGGLMEHWRKRLKG